MKQDSSTSTILTISMGFLFLYFVFSLKWAGAVSLGIGIIGVLSSKISRKIEWAWMKLAQCFGTIIPSVLLTLGFYFFLTPIAFAFRMFNKDILMLSDKHKSYFVDIDKEISKNSFEDIW